MDPTTHTPSLSPSLSSPIRHQVTDEKDHQFTTRQRGLAAVLPRGKPTLPHPFAAHTVYPKIAFFFQVAS
ncbi:hypothetical protein Hanom_Chr09g00809481 [Helianthus anomalus]